MEAVLPASEGGAQGENMSEKVVTPEDGGEQGGAPSETVSKADLERALNDLHKNKNKARELENALKEKEDLLKQMETQRLESEKNYKTLWEKAEANAAAEKKRADETVNSYYHDKKMSKVREIAMASGIRKEALEDLEMLDTNSIIIEKTDHGNVMVHGVEDFVNDLKVKKKWWFESSKAPVINGGQPGVITDKPMSAADVAKLAETDPAKYQIEMQKLLKQRNA